MLLRILLLPERDTLLLRDRKFLGNVIEWVKFENPIISNLHVVLALVTLSMIKSFLEK